METAIIQAEDLTALGEVGGMNYTVGVFIAILILLYLVYTLIRPEKF